MALEGKGYKANAVLVAEETFGTLATGTPVVSKFPLISENLAPTYENIPDETKNGANDAAKKFIQDRYHVTGNTNIAMDYHNIEEIFHLAVGIVSGSGTSGSPYIWEPDAEISASYSLIIDKTKERFQYTGGCIESFTLRSSAAQNKCTMDINWLFQKLTRSATAINNATLTSSEYMKHSQLVFRIADRTDAIAAGDALPISDLEFTWKNNWKAPEFQSGSNLMVQPIRNAPREVTLRFTASRYNSDAEITAIQDALTNGTVLQADMTWTGGTSPRSFLIQLPELMVVDPPTVPVADASPLTFTCTCQAFINTSETIMTTVDYEALFTLIQTSA